jgi:chromosome segregation ATPase
MDPEALEKEIHELKERLNTLIESETNLTKEKEDLEIDNMELKNKVQKLSHQIDEEKVAFEKTKEEEKHKVKEELMSQFESELEKLKKKHLEEKNLIIEDNKKDIEDEITNIKEAHKSETFNLQEKLSKSIEEKENLIIKLQEIEKLQETKELQEKELRENNENNEQSLKVMSEKLILLEKKNQELQSELGDLKAEISQKEEALQIQSEYESKINDLKSAHLNQLEELKANNNSTLIQINKEKVTLESKLKEKDLEIESFNKEITNLKDKIQNFEYDVENQNKSNIDSEGKIVQLNSEISGLKTELNNLRSQKDEIEIDYTKIKTNSIKKEEEVKILLKNIEDKQQNLDNFELDIQEKSEMLIFKEKEIVKMQNKHKEDLEMCEESYQKKIFEWQNKVEDLTEKLSQLDTENHEISFSNKNSGGEDKPGNTEKPSETNIQEKLEFVKNTCKEFIIKMNNDITEYENYIDKRIINSIFLKYFDKGSNEKIKISLLETLANIMGYDNDDRRKIGLSMKDNYNSNSARQGNSEAGIEELLERLGEFYKFIENI